MKISYTSTVLLQQNGRQYSTNGQEGRRIKDRYRRRQAQTSQQYSSVCKIIFIHAIIFRASFSSEVILVMEHFFSF